jgi:hypothetical protein
MRQFHSNPSVSSSAQVDDPVTQAVVIAPHIKSQGYWILDARFAGMTVNDRPP